MTQKTALITGASRGIGKALAEVFASNGYSLILIARTLKDLQTIQTDLVKRYKINVDVLAVDVAKPDAVDTIMGAFPDKIATLDVLINNAGFGISKAFVDMDKKDVLEMMAVNMQFLTNLSYAVLPYMMKNKKGKVLNVASVVAYLPGPYMAMYYATKAYVLSLSESLHEECRAYGVSVSALCPGVTKSSFHERSGKAKFLTAGMPIMTAESVANLAYDGMMNNKRVITTGLLNKLTVLLAKITPNALLTKVTAKLNST